MQDSSFHNKEVYTPLTDDIQQAHGMMKLLVNEYLLDEICYMIFHWLQAVPQSKEVNIILNKIKKLIGKHPFAILLEPDPKIPGYTGNRNLPVAATFMLLFYLTQRCWDLFREEEFGDDLFVEYRKEYENIEEFVRLLDLTTVMNSMFDIIKETVGAEFLTSFWQEWEEEIENNGQVPEGVNLKFNEQLIVNFMTLRGFMDVCFFIFNDTGKKVNPSSNI